MKRRISRQAKIGFFGVTMAVLLYMGINFIKSKKIFSGDNVFYVEYSQADGIEVSSPVLIKGFKVGTVDKISFDIQKSTVIVKMSVDNEYPIPNDSKAKITSASLLGGKVIEIVLGNSDLCYEDGAKLMPLQEQGILEMAGGEYEKLKQQASGLIDQLSKALANVNNLLNENNVANVSKTLENLKDVTGNVNSIVARQQRNIEGVISNLNELSRSLNNEMSKFSGTMDNLNKVSGSLASEAPDLMNNASEAVTKLNNILTKLSSSEGTVGKLVNDDEVYNNLTEVTNSLTMLLEDIKANPKRYINISVFGKKDK